MPDDQQSSNLWMIFALLTVVCWGVYGILLQAGQVGMKDPVNGRYKAFFWVGIACFLIAVLAPAGFLIANGASWSMPGKGLILSLVAGALGGMMVTMYKPGPGPGSARPANPPAEQPK